MAEYDYDMIVIGGGSAGLTSSGIAANFGAKTMMVESNRLGGDCTWTGCIPSKTLLNAAKTVRQMKEAGDFGLTVNKPEINFKKVMEHVDRVREKVYEEADRPEIYEKMGVDVVIGKAAFQDPHTIRIELDSGEIRRVSSKYFIIATGSKAAIPPIEGIGNIDYLTNESLYEIEDFPRQLIIVGGGPIGTEMSQAFANFGSKVTVIDMAERIMTKDDPELAEILFGELKNQGVNYVLNADIRKTEQEGTRIKIHLKADGISKVIEGDALLLATGRNANFSNLNLEAAGVELGEKGIIVNNSCRTNVKHIYAAGDVTGRYQFTHMSEHMAKIAATKALLKYIPMKIDEAHVPWVTFTDPELAHVGATEKQLQEKGQKFEVYKFPYSKIDRAIAEGKEVGLIKIFARKWSGKILGAAVVGAHAGELISEYALAMKNGISLRHMADTIHPYPSWGLGARRAADQWYIKRQSEWQVKLIKTMFGYKGKIPDFSDKDRVV
ncbi:MAG: FAD-dependent oxidoreductase [Balneolaceae bacterium]